MPRLKRFRCWWCARDLAASALAHEVRARAPDGDDQVRRCCRRCDRDPGGAYRAVYPHGEVQEREEVARTSGRLGRA